MKSPKIKTLNELEQIVQEDRNQGKRIVWTNGCFDLVHILHLDLLRTAKSYGDKLIVGLNSDESIKRLKGENRPMNKQEHRAEILCEFESVDYLSIFNEDTPIEYLKRLKPDFYVKGGDYTLDTIVQEERKLIEEQGGKIMLPRLTDAFSTSKLINKIKKNIVKESFEIDSHKLIYHPERVAEWKLYGDCFPIYLEIGATDDCNHKCKFCALDFLERKHNYIDTNVLLENIDNMASVGVKSIMFAGEGEPLLHKDLSKFIQRAKENNIDVSLTTNGVLLDKNKIECMLPYLSWIRFSIDSGSSENYSFIHGTKKKDFEKLMKNIENCVEYKIKNNLKTTIGTQFLVVPDNIDEAKKLTERLKDIGVDNLQIKPYSSHPQSKKEFITDENLYEKLETLLFSYNSDTFKILFRKATMNRILSEKNYDICNGLSFISLIDAKGNVLPCNLYYNNNEFTYGNINDVKFEYVWKSWHRGEILKKIKSKSVEDCRQGCRMDAINCYLHRLKNPGAHENFI